MPELRKLQLTLFLLLIALHAPAQNSFVPIGHFFSENQYTQVSLSPDGEFLAFLNRVNGKRNLFTYDLENKQYTRVSRDSRDDVFQYLWAGNEYLVYQVSKDDMFGHGTFSIRRDGRFSASPVVSEPAELVSALAGYPRHVLVKVKSAKQSLPDITRVNINSRTRRRYFENPGDVDYWLLDREDQVRLVKVYNPEGRALYRYRETVRDKWQNLEFPPGVFPLAFDYDDNFLYVASRRGTPFMGVYRYDLQEREIVSLLHSDPEYDVVPGYDLAAVSRFDGLIFSDQFRTLAGIAYERDGPFVQWLIPFYEDLQMLISKTLPDTQNIILGRDKSEEKFLIFAYSDRDPGNYYLLDHPSMQLTWLFSRNPSINPADMAPMKPVRFTSRDGLPLHGYLTRPTGQGPGPWPLVLIPHGDPQVRDKWGYDPEVQFLANRGYAVLQVNYRGSPGYGEAFFLAAYRQIGRKMQDDLTDAVRWAIGKGIADPARIAIYGENYGGYAAMAGAVFTPGLYRCVIAVNGVYDWETYLRRDRPGDVFRFTRGWVAGPDTGPEHLRAISPVNHLRQAAAGILVIFGGHNRLAADPQSELLVEALQAAGVPHQVYRPGAERNSLLEQDPRLDRYRRIEAFLAEHLK